MAPFTDIATEIGNRAGGYVVQQSEAAISGHLEHSEVFNGTLARVIMGSDIRCAHEEGTDSVQFPI